MHSNTDKDTRRANHPEGHVGSTTTLVPDPLIQVTRTHLQTGYQWILSTDTKSSSRLQSMIGYQSIPPRWPPE